MCYIYNTRLEYKVSYLPLTLRLENHNPVVEEKSFSTFLGSLAGSED